MCWLKLDTSLPEVLLFPLWMWSAIFIGGAVFASSLQKVLSEKQTNLLVVWKFYSGIRVLNKLPDFDAAGGRKVLQGKKPPLAWTSCFITCSYSSCGYKRRAGWQMMTWSRDVLSERLLETSDIFKNIVLEWKKTLFAGTVKKIRMSCLLKKSQITEGRTSVT